MTIARASNRMDTRPQRRNDEGQALPLFALGLIVFLGFVAMSIDVGRYVWARTQMQAAVDAAALAGAQSMPNTAEAETIAQAYWLDNSGFIQAQAYNVQFAVAFPSGSKAVSVEAEADVSTWFAQLFGVDHWHVTAEGEAESQVIDAVVVLDRSGSMCWDSHGPDGRYVSQVRLAAPIDATQTTFTVLKNDPAAALAQYLYVGQVFRLESSSSSEWLEIVALTEPDTVTVQRAVPNPNTAVTHSATSHVAGRHIRGDSCQQAGAAPYHPWAEVKNGAQVFVNEFDSSYDRIGFSHFSTRGGVEMGLTGSFGTLLSAIANAPDPTIYGGDDGRTNIAHGFYLAIEELRANGRSNANLVIVLLSDGVANTSCTPTTYTPTCSSVSHSTSLASSRTLEQADYAAANGITVYTIGYGNQSDDALMQEVADRTGGTFYKAPDDAALQAAFIAIAAETNLRLTR